MEAAARLLELLEQRCIRLALAESCTAGLAAHYLSRVPGCSRVLWGGWVVYDDQAKQQMLGISGETLQRHGAVSRETVRALLEGALQRAPVELVAAISGIAGPGGGSAEKPVGLVWIGAAMRDGRELIRRHTFSGTREDIQHQAAEQAIRILEQLVVSIDKDTGSGYRNESAD
ncbi:CinA family protein [Spirochaeta africana]|uniref:Competence/damage-inducible protein CinA-like protein n=1 Tax=Spirochaeta africana (strain ATCC 700263 / DSM 8902 / Z-7692) TaxID=889378 RepID=H9UKE6_SPIAZ|nr:CinA family protein [Spirochaeta africana]AFG37989.1 competence/damage-inducible protein CinA-like protein [Spirochaeta africana DSM 8902]